MTHEATHASHAKSEGGSAMLPAAFSILLALVWGAYTVTVVYEIIVAMPMPAYPG
jgi:hypothetical protein